VQNQLSIQSSKELGVVRERVESLAIGTSKQEPSALGPGTCRKGRSEDSDIIGPALPSQYSTIPPPV